MMRDEKRILWIDVAKGICMISVIAGHLGVSWINKVVFSYHLTLFFILSGYTLKNNLSMDGCGRKFRRLMVPYFATCAAVLVMDLINSAVIAKDTSLVTISGIIGRDLLRSFMASGSIKTFGAIEIGRRIGAVWYLPATFFAVVTAQFLLKYIPKARYRFAIALPLSFLAHISGRFIWLPFSIQSGFFAVPLILLGYEAKRMQLEERITWPKALLCLCVFAIGIRLGYSPVYHVTADMPDFVLSGICSLASSACIVFISKKWKSGGVLAWIGKNSVYWLCIHLFELETMGTWFRKCLSIICVPYRTETVFLLKLMFIATGTAGILLIKKWRSRQRIRENTIPTRTSNRDDALDMAKAILIALMILGNFTLEGNFRRILYSFHMAAFVIYSGYCFRPESAGNLKKQLVKEVKRFLLPYALFGVGYVLLTHDGCWIELKRVLFGISFTQNLFVDIASIGPVYFILLLFVTKVIYLFLEHFIKKEERKAAVVLVLSLLGMYLGRKGYWLPWSLDCALYALIFYYVGHCLRKYEIMERVCQKGWIYFALSSIWVYMIYKGGMEIAIRNYGNYGLVVLGAVCATMLLYMLCQYLCTVLHHVFVQALCWIGKNTMYILIVHKLLTPYILKLVELRFAWGGTACTVCMILLQLLLGAFLGMLIGWLKKAYAKIVDRKAVPVT